MSPSMYANKLKELEDTRAKLLALEASVADELRNELAGLPAKYGFDSAKAFLKAVRVATSKRRGRKPKVAGKRGKKRTRAVISDKTREDVKKLYSDGKTGSEIAKALGISIPSVQNIKKSLGLVKSRKKVTR